MTGATWYRVAVLLIALLVYTPAALAKDWPTQVADKVFAAWQAEDKRTIQRLAAELKPDPWLVADCLCGTGEFDAAVSFAYAVSQHKRPDTAALWEFVQIHGTRAGSARTRDVLSQVRKALALGVARRALKLLEGLQAGGDVQWVELTYLRGEALRDTEQMAEACDLFQKAADRAEKLGWLSRASSSLNAGGFTAYRYSNYDLALRCFRRRLAIEKRRELSGAEARAILNIGIVLEARGDYELALKSYWRAYDMMQNHGGRGDVAVALHSIGILHRKLGDYAEARLYHERALGIARELEQPGLVASFLLSLGDVCRQLGEYSASLSAFREALQLERRRKEVSSMASVLGAMGLVYKELGNYSKALDHQQRSLKLREMFKEGSGIVRSLGDLGGTYAAVGEYQKALDHVALAADMARSIKDGAAEARALLQAGNVHHGRGDFAEARGAYDKALALTEAMGLDVESALVFGHLGELHHDLGEYKEALAAHSKARAVYTKLQDRFGMAHALTAMAAAYSARGEHKQALALSDQAFRIGEALDAPQVRVDALLARGETLLASKRPDKALDAVHRAARILRYLESGFGDDVNSLRGEWERIFALGTRAAMQARQAAKIWFFLENCRAGMLLEGLGGRRALRGGVVPASLRDEEALARGAESRAEHAYRASREHGVLSDIRLHKALLHAARTDVGDVVARIQKLGGAGGSLAYPQPGSLKRTRALLQKGDALVLYALVEGQRAMAFVITEKRVRVVKLASTSVLTRVAVDLRCEEPGTKYVAALKRLRSKVFTPLPLEKSTKRLIVSPDGALGYVPFSLLVPDGIDVVYVDSGATYAQLRKERTERGHGNLALGRPVLYKPMGDTESLLRDALEEEDRRRSVHLMCDGVIDAERPLRTCLTFAEGEGKDGRIGMLDLFRLKVPADLVVVNGCEVRRGEHYRVEGVAGLSRAFFVAGAPRVLVSLWKVDEVDADRALLKEFHAQWAKGVPAATALSRAQDHVRVRKAWKHPHYWAGWQLWGLPD